MSNASQQDYWHGQIKNASGAVLPAAAVMVKHTETGLTRAVVTNASGGYSVPSLPVGAYEVTAEKPGFRREMLRGIDLVVGQEAVVDLTLQVGGVDQQVNVPFGTDCTDGCAWGRTDGGPGSYAPAALEEIRGRNTHHQSASNLEWPKYSLQIREL